ncbi:hypothetical protein V5O48_015887 [Marasmius crinis-equi]|uniref:Uncharacterized protein n=1 Tax=Marasmius crinis-equi TaxID=585013 RepID=A0ABR3ETB9_9AGAR
MCSTPGKPTEMAGITALQAPQVTLNGNHKTAKNAVNENQSPQKEVAATVKNQTIGSPRRSPMSPAESATSVKTKRRDHTSTRDLIPTVPRISPVVPTGTPTYMAVSQTTPGTADAPFSPSAVKPLVPFFNGASRPSRIPVPVRRTRNNLQSVASRSVRIPL